MEMRKENRAMKTALQNEEAMIAQPMGATDGEVLRRGQFTFYSSFYEAVNGLPKSRQLETYRAIVEYALNGTEPMLTGAPLGVFSAVRPILENARSKAASRLGRG